MTRIVRCRGFGEKENRGMNRDAMIMVRSGLLDRIDAIAAQSGSLKLAQLCEQVDVIRHIARVHDLRPVEQFASTLESALALDGHGAMVLRSEEHTSELQSLMRTSYAVFCLKKKKTNKNQTKKKHI